MNIRSFNVNVMEISSRSVIKQCVICYHKGASFKTFLEQIL